jgi:malonyl-CoA decarboxylase
VTNDDSMTNETITNSITAGAWIERLWQSIQERARSHGRLFGREAPPLERTKTLSEALLSERGEASGAMVARELHSCLRDLSPEDRLEIYRFLARGFGPDETGLRFAAQAYLESGTPESTLRLTEAAEPARQELLRRLNMSPGGTAALVAMRKELMTHLRTESELQPLAYDLHHLLNSWFNRGFLEVRRIDWETPAAVLEKIIVHEAVHEIQGWTDLRRRLAADRRCFAFFHPTLPGEPLIFVEVALVKGLATSVEPLLALGVDAATAERNEMEADTAIFYSISNCQDGLRGISFGNLLIKHVVDKLQAELPQLVRFATLSPIPRFRKWLEKSLFQLRAEELVELVNEVAHPTQLQADGDAVDVLEKVLATDNWWDDPAVASAIREPMMRLCAVYLTQSAKSYERTDPVAAFHLQNGAQLERINWLGNVGPRGIEESYGLMANYLYDLGSIEENHEAFVCEGKVPRSTAVAALLSARRKVSRKR